MQTDTTSAGLGKGLNWPLIIGFWALMAVVLLTRTLLHPPTEPLLGDGDDAMRIVGALDLLHGQDWTDLVQHRDNTPFGVAMHWSRLIDAPLALIMWLATPIFGAAAAPDIAAMVWPLLLLLPLMALSAAVTRQLVPEAETLTAIVLPVVSLVLLIEFLPGRPDHHNVQILLSLVTLLALLAGRTTWQGAVVAGLAVSTSMAIGMETLVFAIITAAIYAVCWLRESSRYRTAMTAFAASLALGAAGHFLLATPPSLYFVVACDVLSIAFVTAVGLGAIALGLTAMLASRLESAWQRFAVLAVLGTVAIAATALMFPDCLRGPYAAVDPRIMAGFMEDVAEMHSLWRRLLLDPPTAIAFTSATLLAGPLTAWLAWRARGEQRVNWLILMGFLISSTLIMLMQMRGARIAAPFAIPAAAWLITEARRRYLEAGGAKAAAALLGAWLLFAGVAHFALTAAVGLAMSPGFVEAAIQRDAVAPRKFCFLESTYRHLAALPPGRVLAPIGIGSTILRHTSHAVVSAGFHRNNSGNLDVRAFFSGDEAEARRVANERGLDYVVLCPGEHMYEGKIGPDDGSTWSWLTPLSTPEERLHIFHIER